MHYQYINRQATKLLLLGMTNAGYGPLLSNSTVCRRRENVNKNALPALRTKAHRRLRIQHPSKSILNNALHTAIHRQRSVISFCPWVNGFDTKLH